MSKGERNRVQIRVRSAMAQAQMEGRFLGGRPRYGYVPRQAESPGHSERGEPGPFGQLLVSEGDLNFPRTGYISEHRGAEKRFRRRSAALSPAHRQASKEARWRRPTLAGRRVVQTSGVQHEDELLDALFGRRRLRLLHAIAPKATLVQDADRARVVHRDMGVQRPDRHLVHQQGERLCRDAAAPELASDPVAEELLPVLLPAADVTRHHAIRNDGAHNVCFVGADLRPVRRELIMITSRKRRHLDSLGIRLVVEEHVEIPVFDTPETHRGCPVVHSGHVQSLLVSDLESTTVSARAASETDYRQAPTTSTVPTVSLTTTDTMVPNKRPDLPRWARSPSALTWGTSGMYQSTQETGSMGCCGHDSGRTNAGARGVPAGAGRVP